MEPVTAAGTQPNEFEMIFDEAKSRPKVADPDGIQVLYEGPRECSCCTNWLETKPEDIDDSENPDEEGHAVVVRKTLSRGSDASKSFAVHSITVHSELARPVLLEMFKDYPYINLDPAAPCFKTPFAPFFDRWGQWEAAVKGAEDERLALHLKLIDQVVRTSLEPAFKAREKVSTDGVISFDMAWTIFQHDSLVYTLVDGQERLIKLQSWEHMLHTRLATRALFAHGEEIEWTGHCFDRKPCQVKIADEYKGHVAVRDLEAYPLEFHPDPDTVKAKLHARGQRYADLKGIHCKDYNATAISFDDRTRNTKLRNVEVNERVMIDAAQWRCHVDSEPLRYHHYISVPRMPQSDNHALYPTHPGPSRIAVPKPGHRPLLVPAVQHGVNQANPFSYGGHSSASSDDEDARRLRINRKQQERKHIKRALESLENPGHIPRSKPRRRLSVKYRFVDDVNVPDESTIENQPPLTDEELLLCTPYLKGYSLRTRKWLLFHTDHIRDVAWNTQAFNQLTLPDEFKELLQATIETQVQRRGSAPTFDDFIPGKGKGLIALLSGSPGVGKTATVEAMSEMLKVPLYHISAAGLGTIAADIDENLREILKMTARWNAVLLLDEADIFLEQRAPNHIEHNAIVSTFLQTLEYHEGVLCLTTNRPQTLDRAVLSRVHLNLVYPDLDAVSRKAIWRRFAAANARVAGGETGGGDVPFETGITEEQFGFLAQSELDGRQIKNVFKTAALLAAWKAKPLDFDILRRALKIVEMQVVV